MAQWLMLDALNPPSPDQLVADMKSVGAMAVAAYMMRRDASGRMLNTGTWTFDHFHAVQSSGRMVLPILVPGNAPSPNDMALAIQAATSSNITKTAIVVDIEQFSFPAPQWLADGIKLAHESGWRVLRYGDIAPLANYPVADGDWLSHGRIPVSLNRVLPMPALPAGLAADQYSVQCVINGSQYDASVIDSAVFGEAATSALEVTQLAGSIVRAPFDPKRLDVVWADGNGLPRVKTSTGGAGGLDSSDEAAVIDQEHVPADGFFHVVALWDDLSRICYIGFANDGGAYMAVERLDGVFDQGWSPLQSVAVAVPTRPAPVVKPAPDQELRTFLRGAPQ